MSGPRSVVAGGVVVSAFAVAGFAASGIPLLDAILLAVLLVAVPVLSVAQLGVIDRVEIERIPAYWSSIATLWMIGTASLLVGGRSGGAAALGLVSIGFLPTLGWTVGLTLAGLAVIVVFRGLAIATGRHDSALIHLLLPRTPRERRVFGVLSAAAGLGEELAYRGYVIPVLAPFVGTTPSAVVSTAVFGIMHGYQGTMGVLRAGVMGGILAWGFLACGSLWPPILAHTLIDVLAGIVLGERLLVSETE